ncbi:MAG: FecR domain-containing protein [Terracidiphilus sp.]|nr:FecR domain-containing protein [Terracidiphilus sp.]
MTTIPTYLATASFSALLLAAALTAQSPDAARQADTTPASGVSNVRIVRLSEHKGTVVLDRNTGNGFEPAVVNMPVVEKSRLMTGDGVAEVEFEDNSSLRLGPNAMVEFPQLERLPAGSTVSSARLVKGMVYVSLLKTRGNEFTLLFGQQQLQLPPGSHIRLLVDGAEAKLAVLDGTLHIDGALGGPAGEMDVTRNKTVTFKLQGQGQDQAQPMVAKNVESYDELDAWDKREAEYHTAAAPVSALNSSPYAYGLSDMGYYGSFMDTGGCGMMWRPYFASAAWDPYSNGVWAWYQGAGYSWVSPYPWGWTPYHYGSWAYCPGVGYGWQPGGAWNGLNNVAAAGPGNGPVHIPVRPAGPPSGGRRTLMEVNLKPLVRSEARSEDSFVLRRDSAGLGVPREGLGNLNKLSQHALDRGTATRDVYMSGPFSPTANMRPQGAGGVGNSNRPESERRSEYGQRPEPGQRSTGGMSPRGGSGGGPSGGGGGASRGPGGGGGGGGNAGGSSGGSGSAPASGHGH